MTTTLIDTKAIAAKLQLSPEYVCRAIVNTPDFPRPCFALSRKSRRWDAGAVDAWIDAQKRKWSR